MTICKEMIVVGMGEMRVMKNQTVVLSCIGLGSCIAICAYDPASKVGGMLHGVLPSGNNGDGTKAAPKFVDSGVPLLLTEMRRQGALKSSMYIKIAGGAHMFSVPGTDGSLNIGERNVAATHAAMEREGIAVAAADVGGNCGRTVQLFVDSGKVVVRMAGGATTEL